MPTLPDEIQSYLKKMQELERVVKYYQERLPTGMTHLHFEYRECHLGHGRVLAKEWYDNGCTQCVVTQQLKDIRRLKAQIEAPSKDESIHKAIGLLEANGYKVGAAD